MKRKYTTFLMLLFCLLSSIQTFGHHELRGQVVDASSNEALIGALVWIEAEGKATTTDLSGNFQFAELEAGSYQISVSYLGFSNTKTTAVLPLVSDTRSLRIELKPAQIELPKVEVKPPRLSQIRLLNRVDNDLRIVNNSQDYLQLMPGLFIAQHAGGGKAEQLFLRGFDLDHGTDLAITVDNMPVNMVSHAHGQGYADLHFLLPELIERVRYQKGPYEAGVGNLATAGSIDLQTKDRIENNLLKLETGQFGQLRGLGLLKLLDSPKDQDLYLAGGAEYFRGYFNSPQDLQRYHLFTKYTGRLQGGHQLTASAGYFFSRWSASGQIPDRAVESGMIDRFGAIDDTEGGNTGRNNLNIELRSPLKNGWLLDNQLYLSHYQFELYSNFTFFANDPINGDQIRQKEDRLLGGYLGSLLIPTRNGGARLGWQIRSDWVRDVELSRTKNREQTLQPLALGDIRETNAALFAEQEWNLFSNWLLNAGVRYDQFFFQYQDQLENRTDPADEKKGIFSPKLNLTYQPDDNYHIYLRLGKGFHSNDTRVVVAQEGREILPAAYGIDLGTNFKPLPNLFVNLAYWQLWLDQEFVYVGDEAVIEAGGATRRQGADLSIRWQGPSWLTADADLTYTHARSIGDPEGENFIPLAPSITGTGGISIRLPNGLESSWRMRYLADRPANEDNSLQARGYFLADLLVRYRIQKWAFTLTAQNVFNTEWEEAQFETTSRLFAEPEPVTEIHYTPGSPFMLRAGVTYEF
jgi:outer membrane receptor protein involved in Fe transport